MASLRLSAELLCDQDEGIRMQENPQSGYNRPARHAGSVKASSAPDYGESSPRTEAKQVESPGRQLSAQATVEGEFVQRL